MLSVLHSLPGNLHSVPRGDKATLGPVQSQPMMNESAHKLTVMRTNGITNIDDNRQHLLRIMDTSMITRQRSIENKVAAKLLQQLAKAYPQSAHLYGY